MLAVAAGGAVAAVAAGGAGGAGGAAAAPRVVNGVEVQDRPTTGALLFPFASGYAQFCSGTLVGCHTFLTAAHCVCGLGDTFASCGPAAPGEVFVYVQNVGVMAVSAVDVHPDYEFASAADVAVLTLVPPASGTGVVPSTINTTMDPPYGTSAEIAGYGIVDGSSGGSGLLRRGLTETSACAPDIPEPAHVCWDFTAPLGPAGLDSNTCSGDSGGPLFADLGAGEVVIGVTSGGSAEDCLPTDRSFDANVHQYADFVATVAGADLGATSCGSISQVGEPGTSVVTRYSDTFDKAALNCRKQVRKLAEKYARTVLKTMRTCVNDVLAGAASGPCPDARAAERVAKAAAKVDPVRLSGKCPDALVAGIGVDLGCAAATDSAALAACIVAEGDALADQTLDSAYTAPDADAELADPSLVACAAGIGRVAERYAGAAIKENGKCSGRLDKAKTPACPDGQVLEKLSKAADAAGSALADVCSDTDVADLDGLAGEFFGGTCAGADSTAGLAACLLEDLDYAVEGLSGILTPAGASARAAFEVPAGTSLLRVTLNAVDEGVNDLDIYLRQGAEPTIDVYDQRSYRSGVFEDIELASPLEGATYHVLVDTYAGGNVPFQLTVTMFQ